MKAREWQHRLSELRTQAGKVVFTVTELANVSGSTPHVLNVELERLCKQGIIVRYARGRYGLPEAVTPEQLLPYLDGHAYMTGSIALHRHNLTTQIPTEITCFTSRRHNRSRVRSTPVGQFVFVCVRPPVYAAPAEGLLTDPEQALCDYVFLMRRRGTDPSNQVTFRGLHKLDGKVLQDHAARYPATTRQTLARLLLSERSPRAAGGQRKQHLRRVEEALQA